MRSPVICDPLVWGLLATELSWKPAGWVPVAQAAVTANEMEVSR
ncbi:hypothetical protein Thimo_1518 [Thioflavicoccus mobilis 8321]|uniref:Uncharacterized protein n=1 Tax=Thioflavicoccus mobilis 8321 TaxID=765912 RepID=L0GWU5_9GAMM|nr:hypothetical protein Thimo_1518 [Thioflavicoccus mobilis 8321]